MRLSDHNKDLFCTLLSGAATPFPNIYDAVSEQILLLILKARQLNEDPEFSKWFAEQHLVLTKLQAKSKKIRKIYSQNSYGLLYKEQEQDKIMDVLFFMSQLYAGFDEGKVSLKTWGEMNRQPTEQRGRFSEQDKLLKEFIQDDMFAILTESSAACPSISPQARKGYCHQDLSIAHSCSHELLFRLNDFHKIESLPILADAIYNLIRDFRQYNIAIPAWLSEFEDAYTEILIGERRKSDAFHKFINLINNEGRDKFVERIVEESELHQANYLLDQFIGIYALEIMQWLNKLLIYFKNTQSTQFTWKYTTVTPDASASSEEQKQQPTLACDSDYCQISITRDTLLQLIHTNTLRDATDALADGLWRFYNKAVQQMLREKGSVPPISESERQVCNLNNYYLTHHQGSYQKNIDILKSFEKWYEHNKILLLNHNKTRIDRVDVEVRLAGLKCYDLKMGIPDAKRMKIKDGVYELVRNDPSLHFKISISDISLQRYHSQVKKIIETDIDVLLLSQQNKNDTYQISNAYLAIKPLWSKSEKPDK
ncbi:hypothetical protein [Aeromonas sp.]|uniref:hypothetical protein n=1 Tax=Aeromonas sp. TaxID=647 RepID=UPI00258D15E1|nr:hypothetical protein [Aeromonas sp.]